MTGSREKIMMRDTYLESYADGTMAIRRPGRRHQVVAVDQCILAQTHAPRGGNAAGRVGSPGGDQEKRR
jgi:hypothetical protein